MYIWLNKGSRLLRLIMNIKVEISGRVTRGDSFTGIESSHLFNVIHADFKVIFA